jgi:hypothetical protein
MSSAGAIAVDSAASFYQLPVAKRPIVPCSWGHLLQDHSDQLGPYLERMQTEDIAAVAAEAFEVVDDN